ncbi:MAG TPA: GAF domain-containing SpoIIE family protein phosphatase [Chthoniobacterales bacterium]|nr:GAF domain-containing SpoIIE family protein phosphatase [Chthoniobacterales bacterium]
MITREIVFLTLLVVVSLLSAGAMGLMVRRVRFTEQARHEIEVEEGRVFEFLHSLGEAFAEGVRSADLHRLIVESATRILDAHGGALYLADRNDTAMVPAFFSKGFPPLIEVPAHILEQGANVPIAVDSYVRLHAVKPGEGLIGEAWKRGEPQLVIDGLEALNLHRDRSMQVGSALVGPLIYRRKCLGILAVVAPPGATSFTTADVKVFHTICEQSAFALYNEVVYLEANEKKRLDHDLAIAREIQSILLPSDPPPVPGYEISGLNIPARQVSGDYFDYLVVDESATGVAIADVSGKGVPASLIMAMCRSVIRSQAPNKLSPAEVLSRVNRQLYPDIKEDMFISMVYLILDAHSNVVRMSRAGHDPPYVFRAATGLVESINPKGMALGIDSGEVFDRICGDFEFTLERGDYLLLYTDGATEALDAEGDEFGPERLVSSLKASATGNADHVIRQLTDDLKNFVGSHPQHDDITLIAIRKL